MIHQNPRRLRLGYAELLLHNRNHPKNTRRLLPILVVIGPRTMDQTPVPLEYTL